MNENATWPAQGAAKGAGNRREQLRVAIAELIVLGAVAYLVWASFPWVIE